jgi:YHS domain-containing protein
MMPENEKKEVEMESNEAEETVYDREGREKLEEDDEIETWEEGFMEGAEDDGEQGKCALCGAALLTPEQTFEREIDGKVYWFCSEEHAEKFLEKKKGEEQL